MSQSFFRALSMLSTAKTSGRRGEIRLANLAPKVNAEIGKARPAVIVNYDAIGTPSGRERHNTKNSVMLRIDNCSPCVLACTPCEILMVDAAG